MAGLGSRNYYSIFQDAKAFHDDGKVSRVNDDLALDGNSALYDANEELCGVRLDLGEGVFMEFRVGDKPENERDKLSFVVLRIKPNLADGNDHEENPNLNYGDFGAGH